MTPEAHRGASGVLCLKFGANLGHGKNFARIQNHFGVEHRLDALHQGNVGIPCGLGQVFDFPPADAVFAGDLTAQLHGLGVELGHKIVHLAQKFFPLHVVGAGVNVQVAVPSVAKGLQAEVIFLGQLIRENHIVWNLGHGHHHVALVQELGLFLDPLQEGGAGGPGLF